MTRPLSIAVLLFLYITTTRGQSKGFHVLITNDDGYSSPGIDALALGLHASPLVATVTVVAPASDRSGAGNKTTCILPTPKPVKTQSGFPAWASSGFPSDCVLWALGPGNIKPDIIVSGINNGINTGRYVCNSGTVGATRTGVLYGVPGIAVSQARPPEGEDWNFDTAVDVVLQYLKNFTSARDASPFNGHVLALNVPTCKGTSNPCTPLIVRNAAEISSLSTKVYHANGALTLIPPWSESLKKGDLKASQTFKEEQRRTIIQSFHMPETDVEAVEAGYVAVSFLSPDLHDIQCSAVCGEKLELPEGCTVPCIKG